jgi:tetratricopeptide (TPR) repeat protein
VGPRPFAEGETLYGRDRETLELTNLLIAERLVLLCSPSGAGKTSLVQAKLMPAMRKEGFTIPPVVRPGVKTGTVPGANRYLLATLLKLEESCPRAEQLGPDALAKKDLDTYLKERYPTSAGDAGGGEGTFRPLLLIFDQFEEVLTADPVDDKAKREFFVQLGRALRDRNRWSLFVIREDHAAALDPYLRFIPTRLSSTYRLDFLRINDEEEHGDEEVLAAIRNPAARAGVEFTVEAAKELVEDLRQIRVQQADGTFERRPGSYVEPVHLQVVCRELWGCHADPAAITVEDLRSLRVSDAASGETGVDAVLARYYDKGVGRAAEKGHATERRVRNWCGQQLISPQGVRRSLLSGEERSWGVTAEALEVLKDAYLVRADQRQGIVYYELAHDRLIQPVRHANAAWRKLNPNPYVDQAALWRQGSENRAAGAGQLLLTGAALKKFEEWGQQHQEELEEVQDFLNACRAAEARRTRRLSMIKALVTGAGIFLIIQAATTVWALIERHSANEASQELQKQLEDEKKRLEDEREHLRESENLKKIRDLRDDALFYATLYTGRDLASNLKATKQAALTALRIAEMNVPDGPTLGRFQNKEQRTKIREECYELLLVLAQAVASEKVPRQDRGAQIVQALYYLDQASSLQVKTRALHLYRARYLAALGDEPAAREERRLAAASQATGALDCFLAGFEEFHGDDVEKAIKDFEIAVHLRPDYFWARYYIAICFLKKHLAADANVNLSACVSLRPNFAPTRLIRGFTHAELGEYRAAEQDYNTALELKLSDEDKYAIHVNRGAMKTLQERLSEAMDDLREAVKERSDRYQPYANMAQLYQKGLTLPASGGSTMGLLGSPVGQGPFLAVSALLSRRTNELREAIDLINKAIELAPTLESLYRIRSKLHLEHGDSQAALRDIEEAIRKGRGHKVLLVLGFSTAALLSSPFGQGPLLAVSSLFPGRVPIQFGVNHFERARVLHAGKTEKEYEQAVQAYDEALRILPDLAMAHRLRGEALLQLNQYEEAIKSFDQYLARARAHVPTYLGTYLARASAKAKLRDYASAIEDYTFALKNKPDSDTFNNRGRMYLLCDAPKLAQADFEEGIRLNRKNAEALCGLGYSLVLQGHYREGIRYANEALEFGPKNSRLFYDVARMYAQAVGVLDRDTTRRGRQDLQARYTWQGRAIDLIRKALHLLPVNERSQFWRDYVQRDSAFKAIRSCSEWAILDAEHSKP